MTPTGRLATARSHSKHSLRSLSVTLTTSLPVPSPGFGPRSCFGAPGLGSPSKLLRGQELEKLVGLPCDFFGESAGGETGLGLFLGDDRG